MAATPPTPPACPSCRRPARKLTGPPWRLRCAGCGHRLTLTPAGQRLQLAFWLLWAGMILATGTAHWLRSAGLPWPLFAVNLFIGVQWIALAALWRHSAHRRHAIAAAGLGVVAAFLAAVELVHALALTGAAAGCVCLLTPAWAVGLIVFAFCLGRRPWATSPTM